MATISRYTTSKGETRWRVRYRTPERRQTDRRGFTRKRDAEDYLAKVTVEMNRGEYVRPVDGRRLVGELGPAWLERQAHVKPSYRKDLRSAWRLHVEPRWGSTQLRTLRTTEIQAWIASMAAGSEEEKRKPLSASVVKRNLRVLAGILDDAVTDQLLAKNPARGVKVPRSAMKVRTYLENDELRRLANEAGRIPPEREHKRAAWKGADQEQLERIADVRYALVLVLGYTGLRWGEATALRARNVDVGRQRIMVESTVVWLEGGPQEGTPKDHERRTVPIPLFLVQTLKELREGLERDALLFPGPDGKYMPPVGGDWGWFATAVERAEIPRVTPHELRHTAASLAISAGANVKAVQRMLGHAKASMTIDVYADLIDSDLEDVGSRLDELYGGPVSRPSRNGLRLVADETGS